MQIKKGDLRKLGGIYAVCSRRILFRIFAVSARKALNLEIRGGTGRVRRNIQKVLLCKVCGFVAADRGEEGRNVRSYEDGGC